MIPKFKVKKVDGDKPWKIVPLNCKLHPAVKQYHDNLLHAFGFIEFMKGICIGVEF